MTPILLLCLLTPGAGVSAKAATAWTIALAPEPLTALDVTRAHPALPELARFPDFRCCRVQTKFLHELEAWLTERYHLLPQERERTQLWLDDLHRVKQAWDLLHLIRQPATTLEGDGPRMERLRQLLGEDDWWRGQMPHLDARFFLGY